MGVNVIVISGSMGAGKTTVMAEASDLLSARGVVHAAIDLDTLGVALLPDGSSTEMTYRNLASVWTNFAKAGVNKLLLADAVENRGELERILRAIPEAAVAICRLTARVDTMQQRIKLREPGMLQEQFVARVVKLNTLLDDARLENFSLQNEERSVSEVARELLLRIGWL